VGQVDSSRWLAYHPWGNYGEREMENFKTWQVTYTAELVSKHHINVALIHEIIAKALRDNAGSIGYLVGDDVTELNGDGDDR
jgi:hypothetical protein